MAIRAPDGANNHDSWGISDRVKTSGKAKDCRENSSPIVFVSYVCMLAPLCNYKFKLALKHELVPKELFMTLSTEKVGDRISKFWPDFTILIWFQWNHFTILTQISGMFLVYSPSMPTIVT